MEFLGCVGCDQLRGRGERIEHGHNSLSAKADTQRPRLTAEEFVPPALMALYTPGFHTLSIPSSTAFFPGGRLDKSASL